MDITQLLLWLLLSVNSIAVALLLFRSYRDHTPFFRGIIETMQEGIWVIDTQARTIYANQAAANLFETTIDQIQGKTVFELIHPEQIPATQESMARRMQGATESGEYEIIRKDGKHLWVRYSALPLYNAKRKVTGALAVFTDITEQHKAQVAISETEARDRMVMENVSDLVYMIDQETRILFLNPTFTVMTGWEVSEWLGKTWYDLLHPDDRSLFQTLLQSVDINHPEVLSIEARLLAQSGEDLILDFRIHPMMKEGQLVGFTGVGRDISEPRHLALQELQIALEYERTGTLRRFMRHASHDIRTPLSVINSSAHLLRRKLDADAVTRVKPQIEMIEAQVMHINEQLNNLLQISETVTTPSADRFKPQALDELVKTVIEEQSMAIERKRHQLIVTLLPSLAMIRGEEEDLLRAIRHLLLNAISYTPEGGRIEVKLWQEEKLVVCSITDSGIGIAPEEFPHIFNPFYRVDQARSLDTGGMGLGLTISKAIIEAHGGSIRVESTPGEGSTFTFTLPAQ